MQRRLPLYKPDRHRTRCAWSGDSLGSPNITGSLYSRMEILPGH
jgi:hypothetical protein